MAGDARADASPDRDAVDGAGPDRPAIRAPGAIALFVILTGVGLAADLLSKHSVFESFLSRPAVADAARRLHEQHPSLTTRQALIVLRGEGFLRRDVVAGIDFTVSTNPGVVFGWRLPPWAVLIATVVTAGLVGVFFGTSPARARMLHVALALVLGGALGNLYDRLFSEVAVPGLPAEPIRREVRDFVDCSAWGYPWVFNVADALLVVGVALLVVHWFRTGRRSDAG